MHWQPGAWKRPASLFTIVVHFVQQVDAHMEHAHQQEGASNDHQALAAMSLSANHNASHLPPGTGSVQENANCVGGSGNMEGHQSYQGDAVPGGECT